MQSVVVAHSDRLVADVLARALVLLGVPARSGDLPDVAPGEVLVSGRGGHPRADVVLVEPGPHGIQDITALAAAVGGAGRREPAAPDGVGRGPCGPLAALTPRELQVLGMVAAGALNATIADTLGISRHTVRTHMQNIMGKLQVESRLAAAALARRHGLVDAGAA